MKTLICVGITLLSLNFNVFADNELDEGPGLFSGKKGEFTILKTENYKKSDKVKEVTEKAKSNNSDMSQKDEFQLYKKWIADKNKNTEAYQEFLLWLEFKKMSK